MRNKTASLLAALLVSACSGAAQQPNPLETAAPSPTPYVDQLQRLNLLLRAIANPLCLTQDPSAVELTIEDVPPDLSSTYPEGVAVGCSTTYQAEVNKAMITCYATSGRSDTGLQSLLAHQFNGHACGLAGIEAGEIEPNQLIFEYFPLQEVNHLSGLRYSRRIVDQIDGGPYIDLTVERIARYSDHDEILETGSAPFESIINYYIAQATLETTLGEAQAQDALKYSLHNWSTQVLKRVFSAAGLSFNQIIEYKRRADVLAIIKAIEKGMIEIGYQWDITAQELNPNSSQRRLNAILYFTDAYRFDIADNNQKANIPTDMFEAISRFYFGVDSADLGQDQRKSLSLIFANEFRISNWEAEMQDTP